MNKLHLIFDAPTFTGFEFYGETIEIDGGEYNYFRLEDWGGMRSVFVASELDYAVHEDVTELFDTTTLFDELMFQWDEELLDEHFNEGGGENE